MRENFITGKGTKTNALEIERRNKMLEYIHEQQQEEELNEEVERINEEGIFESSLRNFVREDRNKQYVYNESCRVSRENQKNISEETFAKIVLESIPVISKRAVLGNKDEIKEKAIGFFRKIKSDSSIYNESLILEEIEMVSDKLVILGEETRLNGEVLTENTIFNTTDIESDLDNLINEDTFKGLCSVIRNKVDAVIKEEKEFATAQALNESGETTFNLYDTLFKEMQVNNVKLALQEYPDLDKAKVMRTAFYETIVDYTIVESANTMKLIDIENGENPRNKPIHRSFGNLF